MREGSQNLKFEIDKGEKTQERKEVKKDGGRQKDKTLENARKWQTSQRKSNKKCINSIQTKYTTTNICIAHI